MKFFEQKIPGVWLIQPEVYDDNRGGFYRAFCMEAFARQGLAFQIQQTNYSINKKRLTLRGIHYRKESLPEVKVLTCVRGRIFNVITDMRKSSPTFGAWMAFELSQQNGLALYLPHGCGNGFLTLEDDTAVHYYHSSIYQNGADTGVRYNDSFFEITWPEMPAVISDKDISYPDFAPELSNIQTT